MNKQYRSLQSRGVLLRNQIISWCTIPRRSKSVRGWETRNWKNANDECHLTFANRLSFVNCIVPKEKGTLRFRVEYWWLMALTTTDSYLLPTTDECVNYLGTARIFSTINGNSCYWQLEVYKSDDEKTDFTVHCSLYQFARMLFVLRKAPAPFQLFMDVILSTEKSNLAFHTYLTSSYSQQQKQKASNKQ